MVKMYQDKTTVKELCRWTQLPRSNFYYQPSDGKRGFTPSTVTAKANGMLVSNQTVVDEIKIILSGEFVCYGYQKVTYELKKNNYIINHKKVYRLMDENNLLLGKVIRTSGNRQWVKHRKIAATRPMEYVCLDIKYLWVHGEGRYYYLLTILDVFTRKNLLWILQRSIRKFDVIQMFLQLDRHYGIKGVNIRNDNGSQFIANRVRQFLRQAEANQEFTHIATPEENAYIEAYHSIVQTEVVDRFEFASFYEAKQTLTAYVNFYNNRRLHSGIDYNTPQQAWDEYEKTKFALSGKAESGNAGEQPARNILTDGNVLEGVNSSAPSFPKLKIFLSHIPEKNSQLKESNDLNSFSNSVQLNGG
jgi:transposase InsO family protein